MLDFLLTDSFLLFEREMEKEAKGGGRQGEVGVGSGSSNTWTSLPLINQSLMNSEVTIPIRWDSATSKLFDNLIWEEISFLQFVYE